MVETMPPLADLPFLPNLGPVLAADLEITVVRHRLGEPLQPAPFR